MFRSLRDSVLMTVFALVYWLYGRSWRVSRVRLPIFPPNTRKIYLHWHGDELLLIPLFSFSRIAVMVSRSGDGELQRRLLSWLGYKVVRGSSSRGGAGGLKGLIDVLKEGNFNASLAVDGPRGPIYRVKPGALKLAQQTGAVLVPGATASSGRFIFKKAWNRCYIPFPFSRCVIVYGVPLTVPADATDSQFEEMRLQLERQLLLLKVEAEATFSREFSPALSPLLKPQGAHHGV
jgi:lysophospholipid acyltransferase (LPLAT)-like uncharacterized protein